MSASENTGTPSVRYSFPSVSSPLLSLLFSLLSSLLSPLSSFETEVSELEPTANYHRLTSSCRANYASLISSDPYHTVHGNIDPALTTDLARETPKSRETVPQFKGYELFLGVPSRARVWEQMAPSVLPALRVNSGYKIRTPSLF